MKTILLLCVLLIFAFAGSKNDILKVYVIPHSHNDIGWLETTQEYFDNCVKHILNTVVDLLSADPKKRFIWVETKFFDMWWKTTTQERKDKLVQILKNKQLEFVVGGWCMNDEANPTYSAIINQMTLGHQWLQHHLNVTTKMGWQLDPFGYSAVTPLLYSQMNFTSHVIVRVPDVVKNEMRFSRNLEFYWNTSRVSGRKQMIKTTVLYNHYNPPNGFKWESSYPMGHDFRANPPITPQNIRERADILITHMRRWSSGYKTNKILYPFGDDFTFMIGTHNFGNMTLLMDYINARPEIYKAKFQYSLLSDFNADEENVELPVRESDLYPYEDGRNAYWTGYYVSYPILKESARRGEQISRTSELLYALDTIITKQERREFEELIKLREANGEMQHHDAITGTAKNPVRDDYLDHMKKGINGAKRVMTKSLEDILKLENGRDINASHTEKHFIREYNKPSLLLFNSLGWTRKEMVKVYSRLQIQEIMLDNVKIPFDQFKLESDKENPWVIFFEANIPPLGYSIYQFNQNSKVEKKEIETIELNPKTKTTIIKAGAFEIEFCGSNLCFINNKLSKVRSPFKQEFAYYEGWNGSGQKSGAYIFRPKSNTATIVTNEPKTTIFRGENVINIVQEFGSYIKQNMTLLINVNHIEMKVDITTGYIPSTVELVTRFRSQYLNSEFYSDNNGFQSFKRSYRNNTDEPISSNMYPMVYSFYTRDNQMQTTFVTNRTIAVGILKNGETEFMIHRRTVFDDGRGVGEPLFDFNFGHLGLSVHIGSHKEGIEARQRMIYELNYPVEYFHLNHNVQNIKSRFSSVKQDLPRNVHLLSFERKSLYSEDKIVRFSHLFTDGEGSHSELSKPVTLNVQDWFVNFNIEKFKSVSLTTVFPGSNQDPKNVEIHPLEIRTFETKLSKK